MARHRFSSVGFDRCARKRYTNASVYATMNLSAANLSNYWGLLQMWQIVAFYFFLPVVALAINFVGVWVRNRFLRRCSPLTLFAE